MTDAEKALADKGWPTYYDAGMGITMLVTQEVMNKYADLYSAFALIHEGGKALEALALAVGRGKVPYTDAMTCIDGLMDWYRRNVR